MHESHKHIKSKRPDPKEFLEYVHIYMKFKRGKTTVWP